MSQGALVLREVNADVWDEFARGPVRDGGSDETRLVIERWQRSRDLGASLEGPPEEEHLVRGEPLKLISERTEIVQHVGATDFERTAGDLAARAYVMLLVDPTGVVVRSSGGGAFSGDAEERRLITGAEWSEKKRGTNAIGTAIAEQRPVYVRGTAHFARRYHDLVCYAAPIFDADGTMVAVLDATSWFTGMDDAIGDAVIRTAGAMTRALRDRAFAQAGRAVTRTLARALDRMEGIAFLLEPPARITRMNTGAKILLGDRTGHRVDKVLGLEMAALEREGREARGLLLELEGREHTVRVDPIETADGRLIALLVFLEPRARRLLSSRPAAPETSPFEAVFSLDSRLSATLGIARQLADSDVPALLTGEGGTGKELVARTMHAASRRAAGPFVTVDCEAMTRALQEVELFGYDASAFTGALPGGRIGLATQADGGTLFVDEVGELTSSAQSAIVRLLEHGTFRRHGEVTPTRVDVRLIFATRKDLAAMVEANTFRRDLFHVLKKAELPLLALRTRTDRVALAVYLLGKLAEGRNQDEQPRLSSATLALLERYSWPGNVRELQRVLEVSLLRAGKSAVIEPEHLPSEFGSTWPPPATESPEKTADLEIAERATVRRVLSEVDGNVSLAARRLGVARSTLYRMMRRHGLVPS